MKSVLLLTWGPCTRITQGRTNIYAYMQTKFCTLDILTTKVFGRHYSHNDHKTGALKKATYFSHTVQVSDLKKKYAAIK